jgi:hypothetical protein
MLIGRPERSKALKAISKFHGQFLFGTEPGGGLGDIPQQRVFACSMSKLTIGPIPPGFASLGVLSLVDFDHCFVAGLSDNPDLVRHW